MRIVQLVARRQRRGAEVFAADLSTMLARRGHEVVYVGLGNPPAEPLLPDRASVYDVRAARLRGLSIGAVRHLAHYLRQLQPDIVQANGGCTMKYAAVAKWAGANTWPIVNCNVGISSDWLRWPGQRMLNAWLMKSAAFTAAVSDTAREDLIRTFDVDPERVGVIRRGVATGSVVTRSDGRKALRSCGVDDSRPVLLHVGSFTPEKNHIGLLRIFDLVQSTSPGVQLVLVGDGPLRSDVEWHVGGRRDVRIAGVRADVSWLMAGADLMLLPSLTEGIPGVVLEAGAQGLPAIAYDVGGIQEAIRHGETGYVVPQGDERGFADAVLAVLSSPHTRERLGSGARQFISAEYSLGKSVDEFEAAYQRVCMSVRNQC